MTSCAIGTLRDRLIRPPRIVPVLVDPTDSNSVTNTATKTAFDNAYTFAPGELNTTNKCLRIVATGRFSTENYVKPPSLNFYVQLDEAAGSTIDVFDTGDVNVGANVTDGMWHGAWLVSTQATGSSGTGRCMMEHFRLKRGGTVTENESNKQTATVDFTDTLTIQLACKWSSAHASRSVTMESITVEVLN